MNNPQPVEKKIETKIVPAKPIVKVEKTVEKAEGTIAKKPVEKVAEKPKEEVSSPSDSISAEAGINLIPTLTKAEVVVADKKKKLNMGSITSLLVLVVISILIVGFNIVSRMTLNSEKERLKTYESKVNKITQKIISSNEITERVRLYKKVLGETYSPKSVVDYINALASKSGTSIISNFSIGNDLTFAIEGDATDMENVSKFWYLLSNDPKVETVTLQSVGSGTNDVRFTFKGKLVLADFLSSNN